MKPDKKSKINPVVPDMQKQGSTATSHPLFIICVVLCHLHKSHIKGQIFDVFCQLLLIAENILSPMLQDAIMKPREELQRGDNRDRILSLDKRKRTETISFHNICSFLFCAAA